jgi:MFS family permease
MHRIGVAWLAWELTGSAFWVGAVAFADLAPAVLASPIAGAYADRVDRVRMAMIAQALIGLNSALIAGLTLGGAMSIGLLIALEVAGGVAASFAQPSRQTLISGLVPANDLPAAVAINSLVFNVARFIGPALAGPIILGFGVAPAIAANALCYAVACATLPLLRLSPEARLGHAPSGSVWAETREGFSYVVRHPGLGPIMLYAALSCALLRGLQEVLPPFVERLFERGPEALALLTACFGVGALAAGIATATRGRLQGTTRTAVGAIAVQAVATAGFVATSWFGFALLCAALIGAAASQHGIAVQTLAQTASAPAMRGRVMAIWGLIVRGCPALGALAIGGFGEAFGMRPPVLAAAALALGVFAWGWAQQRRIAEALEGPPAR